METADRKTVLEQCIREKLKPIVRKIDADACYPLEYLSTLGTSGLLRSDNISPAETVRRDVMLIEETAKTCMTTAFNLWCHLAASTYLRRSDNSYLKHTVLTGLENGKLRGGTGLSNPMKYYGGLEKLHLSAERADTGGYTVSGQLPMVSNLGADHWFGIVASVEDRYRMMAFVSCHVPNLIMKEKLGYLALNGSATYACSFDRTPIPDEWVLSENADDFIVRIRPIFLLYQIPLGLGVTAASIKSIEKAEGRQGGCNRYLPVQRSELNEELGRLREMTYSFCGMPNPAEQWKSLLELRLQVVLLTLKAVQADMLHQGGSAYLQASEPSRRLREAYFLANLTPTVKHLEKLRSGIS
ncbi:acyl-CoA dehydrogenase [Paenibacillus hamazuiensis]|uniref:acyl-CoA dehydrogenase n=1 Tax=Paenibacillus hamazuiensis TaxID=2936508 RepID=UPI00200C259D|nr:acyl-CoA dehydrogenase [Paenibacillus hamazuiensis]